MRWKFPAGFYIFGMAQTKSMFLKYTFSSSDRNKLIKFVIVSLITFTNTSIYLTFVCNQCFPYSSLTLPLVQLAQQICLYIIFFFDPV